MKQWSQFQCDRRRKNSWQSITRCCIAVILLVEEENSADCSLGTRHISSVRFSTRRFATEFSRNPEEVEAIESWGALWLYRQCTSSEVEAARPSKAETNVVTGSGLVVWTTGPARGGGPVAEATRGRILHVGTGAGLSVRITEPVYGGRAEIVTEAITERVLLVETEAGSMVEITGLTGGGGAETAMEAAKGCALLVGVETGFVVGTTASASDEAAKMSGEYNVDTKEYALHAGTRQLRIAPGG